ncbi:hypothetical protein CVT24_012032 [Panaeolus cyanescens]|uniref:Protein N-terminal and lysine N-methyltransferase EFM7 n=1 Tax=Panaeolus cyanescens TaxID=181874 RepID=A0A409YNC7_9AGAR|nr:hypothetical protein CVT24_012032 [Panaeolus cyanescens]
MSTSTPNPEPIPNDNHRQAVHDEDDDEPLDLDSVFTEPPRPPTPPPTISTYHRDSKHLAVDPKDVHSSADWKEVNIRLVGSHPLWGHHLWNAAIALADYLDDNTQLYRNKNVLELGAGGALPSIVTWKNGARKTVITDYPDHDLVQNMKFNVENNMTSDLDDSKSRAAEEKRVDVQHTALLKTCEEVLAPGAPSTTTSPSLSASELPSQTRSPQPCVLVFYTHHRPHLAHRDMQFFEIARERGWTYEEVVRREFKVGGLDTLFFVFCFLFSFMSTDDSMAIYMI